MSAFEDSVLRVLSGDAVVGAAFLVSDHLVATCAHVVKSAGGEVGRTITLGLSKGQKIGAQVVPEYWRDETAEDVSILRLNEPLENIEPVILGSSSGTKGHNFSTFGFPNRGQELSGGGEIIGQAIINGIIILQLRSPEVTPGFSGAPIFDEITKRVVGMVVAITPPDEYQRLGTTAFAIPSETIREICPELQISDICPFRGLDVFNEEDAPFFFGRERVVQKMIDSMKREPRFLAVLGPSGSGKSSVVRAGLIPALKQGKLPGSDKWDVIMVHPASQPFEQLDGAGLSKSQDGIENAVRTWLENHPDKTRFILVIDQFEELLVSTPEAIRQKFLTELSLLLNSPVAITAILTLRDDFYSRFQQDAALLTGWLESGLVNIPVTLDRDELHAMVVEPAKAVGLSFEEGLVDVILDDAVEADRAKGSVRSTILPLLEFALTQLWERRQNGQLTHSAYQDIDGVTGGLTQWADKVFYALDENEKLTARLVLSRLVRAGDEKQGIPDTRQSKSVQDILLSNHDLTLRVLNKLVEKRLLTAKRDENAGLDTVELIHEALLSEWRLLQTWIKDDRPSLLFHQALTEVTREWAADSSRKDLLYRGKRLEQAIGWENKNKGLITSTEKRFIDASIKQEREDRLRKKVFWGMAGVIVAFLLVLGPGMWGYRNVLRLQAMQEGKLVEIVGGEIVFGTDAANRYAEEGEPTLQHVKVPSLWAETTEVTQSQYDKCVKAKVCTSPNAPVGMNLEQNANHPVIFVTAIQAKEYCSWLGRRLPETYEWELIARGTNGRPWPWYNENLPSHDAFNLPLEDKGNVITPESVPVSTTPVGNYPNGATKAGVLDLFGNVWEWTSSAMDVQNGVENGRIINWDGDPNSLIIQRGGGYDTLMERITQIRLSRADVGNEATGFRCVQNVVP
jgi:formylglycine-generating enzyme required for sulfatase activity